GNAYLRSGEIEEAARVVGDAAGLAAKTRSARLVSELRATRERMRPWRDTQAVAVRDDRVMACGLAAGVHPWLGGRLRPPGQHSGAAGGPDRSCAAPACLRSSRA